MVNPILGFLVIGIFNLGGGIDCRTEVFEKRSAFHGFSINLDIVRLIRFDNERVQSSELGDPGRRRGLEMLLFVFARNWILVLEYEMNLSRRKQQLAISNIKQSLPY